MIKAEAISHEGNPGPNWLDRWRTVATPTNITVVLLLVIGIVLFAGLAHKQQVENANKQPKTTPTVQPSAAPVKSLEVQPLSQATTTTASGNANIQNAAGGLSSTNTSGSTQGSEVNSLGASTTSGSRANPAASSSQKLLNAKTLTNTVQSTIKSVTGNSAQSQSQNQNAAPASNGSNGLVHSLGL